ncbi:DUF1801 domain-containing protein [Robiginitalea sp. IMCC44478]|uniref:DUF1801 domain-containing protein n=1 Tax=Robiginitalea sp. IMCC44478 TaxID=3459122 RepID=UPI004042D750
MNPSESYILEQAEPYRTILIHLQTLIEQGISSLELRFKYRIPFYYLNGRPFCYLNKSGDYVDLGIPNGYRLKSHQQELQSKGRKSVRSLRFRSIEEIDADVLLDVLKEAEQLVENRNSQKSI